MFEKVNPCHPDKVADRIAGALVDAAYSKEENPRIAVEVLTGHGECHIIAETSVHIPQHEVEGIVRRILGGDVAVTYNEVPQDKHLAANQEGEIRCGDNGIFKGSVVTKEQYELAQIAKQIYKVYPTDGKYIKHGNKLIICQSNCRTEIIKRTFPDAVVNPIGDWTGGINVDSGATNRKLGSDMGDGVTGGGLHGKDLSKADVSANIYCHIIAQQKGREVTAYCAIGDTCLHTSEGDVSYSTVVAVAREYIKKIGGFEKFAEWGLVKD